jgi:hypothetical protein
MITSKEFQEWSKTHAKVNKLLDVIIEHTENKMLLLMYSHA